VASVRLKINAGAVTIGEPRSAFFNAHPSVADFVGAARAAAAAAVEMVAVQIDALTRTVCLAGRAFKDAVAAKAGFDN